MAKRPLWARCGAPRSIYASLFSPEGQADV
jgi:hypothetical protein